MRFQEPVADDRHLGLGVLQRPATPETRDHRERSIAPILARLGRHLPRAPQRRAVRHIEAGRRDADDLVRLAVDLDGLPDDVGAGREAALPQRMAEHDDTPIARRVGRVDEPSERRRLLEDGEVISRNLIALHALGLVRTGEVDLPPAEDRHALECLRLVLPVEEVRRRDRFARIRRSFTPFGHDGQTIDVRQLHGERPEDERVEHRERGRVSAEADRERQHNRGRDERIARERPARDANLLDECAHGPISEMSPNRAPACRGAPAERVEMECGNLRPVPGPGDDGGAALREGESFLGKIAHRRLTPVGEGSLRHRVYPRIDCSPSDRLATAARAARTASTPAGVTE
jgi:hypothetical protein